MDDITTNSKNAFHLLGGLEGIRALADSFYDIMEEVPEARGIRDMHPKDLGPTRENLTLFLSGWLGGPPLYVEKHGSVNLTNIHALLDIDVAERDMWLACMEQALHKQHIADDLKISLLNRFRIPADKIRATCQQRKQGLPIGITNAK